MINVEKKKKHERGRKADQQNQAFIKTKNCHKGKRKLEETKEQRKTILTDLTTINQSSMQQHLTYNEVQPNIKNFQFQPNLTCYSTIKAT